MNTRLNFPSIYKYAPLLLVTFSFLAISAMAQSSASMTHGIIRTVAGSSSEPGFGGDGGLAINALLSMPRKIAIDASGTLWISDESNNRIREVSPDGIISTVAGIGPDGFLHDGIVGYLGSYSGDGGLAVNAALNHPNGVALDSSGDLFVCDTNNWRVRKITPSGKIFTVAGNGQYGQESGIKATSAPLSTIRSIAVGQYGELSIASDLIGLYYVDRNGILNVSKVKSSQTIGKISDVALSAKYELYFADEDYGLIRYITHDSWINTVVSGLTGVEAIALDAANNLFFTDKSGNVVWKLSADGVRTRIAGSVDKWGFSGDGGPATSALLDQASGLAIDADGNLYISDSGNCRIRKVSDVAAPGLLAGRPFPGSGDLNRDGLVDLEDAILALRGAIGSIALSPEAKAFGDVNGDGALDLKDVAGIMRKAIKSA